MKFTIEKEIFNLYPDFCVGVVLLKDFDNSFFDEVVLSNLQKMVAHRSSSLSKDDIKELDIVKKWRAAYKKFGVKPKNYTSSIENLLKMSVSGIEFSHINTLVDIYNYISLKHFIPMGGDDIDCVDGGINLSLAKGNEVFKKLDTGEQAHPKKGEVIYSDDVEVLCRRFNWRECEKTKLTKDTKNALLYLEALGENAEFEIENAFSELKKILSDVFKKGVELVILNKENNTFNL